MNQPAFLRLSDLATDRKGGRPGLLGLSENTILRMVRAGRFPKPVRLGPNSVAWPAGDVTAWIEARIADGRASQAEAVAQ